MPLMVTGFWVAVIRIQSRAWTPDIDHSTVCSLAVRHTRVVTTFR